MWFGFNTLCHCLFCFNCFIDWFTWEKLKDTNRCELQSRKKRSHFPYFWLRRMEVYNSNSACWIDIPLSKWKYNLNSKSREILYYAFLGSMKRKGWKLWSTTGSATQALLSSVTSVHKTHYEDSLASLLSLCPQLPPVPQLCLQQSYSSGSTFAFEKQKERRLTPLQRLCQLSCATCFTKVTSYGKGV